MRVLKIRHPFPGALAWLLAFLLALVNSTSLRDTVHAAQPAPAPSSSATPQGPTFFVTWSATASHSDMYLAGQLGSYRERRVSYSIRGSGIAHFDQHGNRVSALVLTASDSHQFDLKDHEVWHCGDFVDRHDHLSAVQSNLVGDNLELLHHLPVRQPDGSWLLKDMKPGWPVPDTCLWHIDFADKCSGVYNQSISTSNCGWQLFGDRSDGIPRETWDLPSKDPGYFSKHIHYDVAKLDTAFVGDNPPAGKIGVDWTITVRAVGKCLVGGKIPLDGNDHGINDEDIEMGVESGKNSIAPDDGVAPINLRVTCDGIPIRNAQVNVKVDVQKNTGGHMHNPAGRPRGSLNGTKLTDDNPNIQVRTDDDGKAHLTFQPGKALDRDNVGIAGIYQITASPERFPYRQATVAVEAKVDGLKKLDSNNNYIDGCTGASHELCDYATEPTRRELPQMAADFIHAQEVHNLQLNACGQNEWKVYKLYTIDESLPYGGLYDFESTWATPHQTHGKGVAVDFSVNRGGWPEPPVKVCDGYTSSPKGWLTATMMQVGLSYGHWDAFDLCQHPNVCSNHSPWASCCSDNITCPASVPRWVPGFRLSMVKVYCPGTERGCLHCPTDQLWHLKFNQ